MVHPFSDTVAACPADAGGARAATISKTADPGTKTRLRLRRIILILLVE